MRKCAYCGNTGDGMWMVTFDDAPAGGVPVHDTCLHVFFTALDMELSLPRPRAAAPSKRAA